MTDHDIAAAARRKGPTGPGFTFMAVSLAVLVVVSFLSFTARQPPPPTIAEFAPQAIEPIEDAPPEQSSDTGSGDGIGGSARDDDSDGPLDDGLGAIEVPRVRRCVGNPPRQIEDPQSPPCVPYWAGDNGGATWRGVTADEIRVVIPTCESSRRRIYDAMERFFNKRFEFYGRKLRFHCGQDGNGSGEEPQQKADARGDFDEFQPFAASRYFNGSGTAYSNEMARFGVVSITQAFLDIDLPTLWSYWMEADDMFANMGEWACNRLVGKRARYGGPDVADQPRRFGIIIETGYEDDPTHTAELEDRLERCGAVIADRSINEFDGAADHGKVATIMVRMKAAEVTSIFCFCKLLFFGPMQVVASEQAYFPEWIISTYGADDLNTFIKLGGNPPEQMEHTFGVSFQPRQLTLTKEPWWWAIKETDPSFTTPDSSATVGFGVGIYRPLLVLASGIQMAGPNLTPATFERGLQRAVFPNPPHENIPGALGFARGAHGGVMDATEIWWSNTALGPFTEDSPGTYCYLDGGARRRLGSWPKGDGAFFEEPCFSGRDG